MQDVRGDHRGRRRPLAEKLLDRPDVVIGQEAVGGDAVPEGKARFHLAAQREPLSTRSRSSLPNASRGRDALDEDFGVKLAKKRVWKTISARRSRFRPSRRRVCKKTSDLGATLASVEHSLEMTSLLEKAFAGAASAPPASVGR